MLVERLIIGREADVSVVSIVGIGSLGKTTLAQLIFNDQIIQQEFTLKMWVCVSNDFNLKTLLDQILNSATDYETHQGEGVRELQKLQNDLY